MKQQFLSLTGMMVSLFVMQIFAMDTKMLYDFNDEGQAVFLSEDASCEWVSRPEEPSNHAVRVTFGTAIKQPEVCKAIYGYYDIGQYVYVVIDVQNCDQQNPVQVFGYFNDSIRGNGTVLLGPGEKGELVIPLCRDYNKDVNVTIRNFLKRNWQGIPGGYLSGYTPSPDAINAINIHVLSPRTSHTILIDNIRAQQLYTTNQINVSTICPFVDEFGQYALESWPGKTTGTEDLAQAYTNEQADLLNNPGPSSWNSYGGWREGPRFEAKGYFRTEKINGRWWFIDPEGCLFWSNGIDVVTPYCSTPLKNATGDFTSFFSKIPDFSITKDGSFVALHYQTNLRNKYYAAGISNWQGQAGIDLQKRLKSWGVNTLGAWSDITVCKTVKVPYAVCVNTEIRYRTPQLVSEPNYWSNFRTKLEEELESIKDATVNDPYCIGYFIDNEITWSSEFTSSDLAYHADIYYRHCKEAVDALSDGTVPEMKKLYLGSRKHIYSETSGHLRMEELAAMAAHCDVISLNRYTYTMRDLPLLGSMGPQYDKPVLFGEFHFGALDRGLAWGGICFAQSQSQRAKHYQTYIRECLEHPNVVGAHYYQYTDQMFTTRALDGENGQIGWVDICDKPYQELVDAARLVNHSLYQTRQSAWQPGVGYSVGNCVSFNGKEWECVSAHYSLAHWYPGAAGVYLWVKLQ